MNQLTCDEVRELLPAYALNALDDASRALVEAALPGCEGCAQLLDDYLAVDNALLHIAVRALPPPELRSAIMQRAGATSRRPVAAYRASAARPRAGFIERLTQWFSGAMAVPRGALGLAALVAVFALGLLMARLAAVSSQTQQLSALLAAQEAQARQLQAQLNAQTLDMQQLDAQLAQGRRIVSVAADVNAKTVFIANKQLPQSASLSLRFSQNNQAAVLSIANLPPLSDQQTYQLWLFDASGKLIPSTVFSQVATAVLVETPATLGSYVNFAVSIEPKAGSLQPTGPVVAIAY